MFGIGSTELLVILVVALIVLGPRSLAGVSRTLGKAMGEFRRVSTDFQRALNVEVAQDDLREARRKKEACEKKTPEAKPVEINADSPVSRALNKAREAAENSSDNKPNA